MKIHLKLGDTKNDISRVMLRLVQAGITPAQVRSRDQFKDRSFTLRRRGRLQMAVGSAGVVQGGKGGEELNVGSLHGQVGVVE
jgi:hypothetical protein